MSRYFNTLIWTTAISAVIMFKCSESAQQARVTKNSINRFADAALLRIKENTIKSETELIPVEGVGPYGNGKFSGLASIKRQGNAVFNRHNLTVTVPATLGQNSKLWFPCNIVFLGRNVCRNSEATFEFQDFYVELVFHSKLANDGLPQLKICDVKDPFGRSVLQLGAIGSESPLITIFGGWFYTFARSKLTTNLQDSLCNAIATNA